MAAIVAEANRSLGFVKKKAQCTSLIMAWKNPALYFGIMLAKMLCMYSYVYNQACKDNGQYRGQQKPCPCPYITQ